MAIGGAFLGGGVELVPAGSCKLELEAYTDNATVSATFTITGGGNTYTVTSGTDGRASKVVPSGVTYTVSATVTGYTAPPSQTVIAESSSIKYVRFDAQLKKAQGDISILQTDVDKAEGDISTLKTDVDKAEGDISTLKTDVGNAQGDISILQTDVKRAQSTADSKASTDVATQSANGLMSSADKTKLDGVDSALAGKVSKSGDTMTGLLIANGGIETQFTRLKDSNGTQRAFTYYGYTDSQSTAELHTEITTNSGEKIYPAIKLFAYANGNYHATLTSNFIGTNDNSDKVLTIKMANSLPSLVHTTGNETILGMKKFTNTYWNVGGIAFQDPRYGISDADKPLFNSKFKYLSQFPLLDKNNVIISNEILQTNADNSIEKVTRMRDSTNTERTVMSVKLNASDGGVTIILRTSTPSNATENEIVTANWANNKFQRKITYGTGDPPSGGQAGDIYIKI